MAYHELLRELAAELLNTIGVPGVTDDYLYGYGCSKYAVACANPGPWVEAWEALPEEDRPGLEAFLVDQATAGDAVCLGEVRRWFKLPPLV